MSNFPSAGSLGSVYVEIGYDYDPRGMAAFIRDADKARRAQADYRRELIQAGVPLTNINQAFRTYEQVQKQGLRTQQQTIAAQRAANLELASSAGRVRILRGELATLTAGTKDYYRAQIDLSKAEAALRRERERTQGGLLRGFNQGTRGFSMAQGALGAVGVGIGLNEVRQFAQGVIELRAELDQTRRTLGAFLGDMSRGDRIWAQAIEFGNKYAFTQEAIGQAVQSSMQIFRTSAASTQQTLDVLNRLAILNPQQGLEGAAYAVREIASGDVQSIADRFNISRTAANRWKDEIKAGGDAIEVINRGLNEMGLTSAVAEERLKGMSGEIRTMQKEWETFRLSTGDFLEKEGIKLIDWAKQFVGILNGITLGGDETPFFGTSVKQGKADAESLLRNSGSLAQYREGARALYNQRQAASEDGIFGPDAIWAARARRTALGQVEGMDDAEFQNARLLQAQKEHDARMAEQYEKDVDAYERAQQRKQLARDNEIKTIEENQAKLGEAAQKGADDLLRADEARIDRLEQLEKQHNDTMTHLQDENTQAFLDHLRQKVKAEADYVDERGQLLQKQQDAIDAFNAAIGTADTRRTQDRRIQDARDQEDYDDDRAQAQTDHEDEMQKARDAFDEREADARAEHNKKLQEQEEQAAAERIALAEQTNAAMLGSTASFLQQMFSLTRGRARSGDRAKMRQQLSDAQAEAAELAKIDPTAAAQLLAERQRQILAGVQFENESRDLKRGANRSTRPQSRAAVEEEISIVGGAMQASFDANAAAIKAEAARKAEERTKVGGQTEAEFNEGLEKDRARFEAGQQEQEDQWKERRQREADQRAELLRERDEDRALEDARRLMDQTKQLQDLKDNNKLQLDEFDDQHRKTMEQMDAGFAARTKAIDDQMAAERKQYTDSVDLINDQFATFSDELKTKMATLVRTITQTPDEAEARQIQEAWQTFGYFWGEAVAAGFQQGMGNPAVLAGIPASQYPGAAPQTPGSPQAPTPAGARPPVRNTRGGGGSHAGGTTSPAGGRTYTRGAGYTTVPGKNDPRLSDQAIDTVIIGGTQTDTFNADRNGSPHHGVDIATPLGTPVRLPFTDGKVENMGYDPVGGIYMTVTDMATNDYWYFGHLSSYAPGLDIGSTVTHGQTIAYTGQTPIAPDSQATGKRVNGIMQYSGPHQIGPHLHLQVKKGGPGGQFQDPSQRLEDAYSSSMGSASGRDRGQGARSEEPGGGMVNAKSAGGGYGYTSPGDRVAWASGPQGVPGGSLFGLPLPLPVEIVGGAQPGGMSWGGTPITVQIDARGSTGIDLAMVEALSRKGAYEGLTAYTQGLLTQTKHLDLQGPARQ